MLIATAAPADDDDRPFDLELLGLELEYRLQQRFTPELRRQMDLREAAFRAELDARPEAVCERERILREHADYRRRKERRRFVESGEAARAARREVTQPDKPTSSPQPS